MLGFIQGRVVSKTEETSQCVVLVNGVGYELTVSRRLFDALKMDEERAFWVHLHVREDTLNPFGFETPEEKQFFRVLLGVSGLGPKHALALLSEHAPESLQHLILSRDTHSISKAHGIGKKLAERLVLELSSKLDKLALASPGGRASSREPLTPKSRRDQLYDDLASALGHLGYVPAQIKTVLDKLFAGEDAAKLDFEGCLKGALKELSGRSITRTGGVEANV